MSNSESLQAYKDFLTEQIVSTSRLAVQAGQEHGMRSGWRAMNKAFSMALEKLEDLLKDENSPVD